MPELPDVETFKRYLDATSLHQRINNVDVRSAFVLKRISGAELSRKLKGRRFESSRRHGKHLLVRINGQVWLRLHFGMTGFLSYLKDAEKTSPHARVIFVFANGYRLAFDDQRKFGEVGLVEDVDAFLKKRPRPGRARCRSCAIQKDAGEASWQRESGVNESAAHRRHRQYLCRRNSFPRSRASSDKNLCVGGKASRKAVPRHAPRPGKSNRVPGRSRANAEVMVAVASAQGRKVSSLRTRITIVKHWRTHCVVLRALPEACTVM